MVVIFFPEDCLILFVFKIFHNVFEVLRIIFNFMCVSILLTCMLYALCAPGPEKTEEGAIIEGASYSASRN